MFGVSEDITSDMVDAGLDVLESMRESCPDFLLVGEIYRAMWAASPEGRAARRLPASGAQNDK